MTIYCSSLPNDQDMIKALGSHALPLPIPCGDCNFSGYEVEGRSLAICVERKKCGDLAACVLGGRYLFQAQNAKTAGYDCLILVVEGRYRRNPDDGLLEIPVWGINPRTMHRAEIWEPVRPTISYSRFEQFLTECDYLAGIIVKRTESVRETADCIIALWEQFQTAPADHNSLHTIFKAPLQEVLLMKPSLIRRIAVELPGVGWTWSKAVANRFLTVMDMVNASVEEWAELELVSESGKKRRLGKTVAAKVVAALRGGKPSALTTEFAPESRSKSPFTVTAVSPGWEK